MSHDLIPLRWFFPPPRPDAGWRGVVRGAAGFVNIAGHEMLRVLPIDLASLIAQEIWSRVGPYRFPDVTARMAQVWSQLRPGETAPHWIEAMTLGMWRNIGRVVGEYSVLDRLWPAGRIAVEGAEEIAAARGVGRAVIVMGLHLGNWEVIAPAIGGLGHPVTMIYQRPADRIDHDILVRMRLRSGIGLLTPDPKSARAALRILQQRSRVLLIFGDEWIDDRVNAPAFGRPPRLKGNLANIARLAAMTDAVIIPAYSVRTGGAHFRLRFLPPVDIVRGDSGEAALAANVAHLDAAIESIVRAHLDQWLMLFEFRFDR
jgi:KDO2-lipid IV(A) lauroyltransferase